MEALAPIILELHTRPTVDKNEIKITSSPEDDPQPKVVSLGSHRPRQRLS